MSEEVVIIAQAKAQPGKSEELGKQLLELLKASRLQEGVLQYDLHRSTKDPDTWVMYEKYESQKLFEAHVASEPLQKFLSLAPDLVEGGLKIKPFELISEE
jgi:quinol monooxygenase YgiN